MVSRHAWYHTGSWRPGREDRRGSLLVPGKNGCRNCQIVYGSRLGKNEPLEKNETEALTFVMAQKTFKSGKVLTAREFDRLFNNPAAFASFYNGALVAPPSRRRQAEDWMKYLWQDRIELARHFKINRYSVYTLHDDGTISNGFGIVDVDGYFLIDSQKLRRR